MLGSDPTLYKRRASYRNGNKIQYCTGRQRRSRPGNWTHGGRRPNQKGSLHPDGGSHYYQDGDQHWMPECEDAVSDMMNLQRLSRIYIYIESAVKTNLWLDGQELEQQQMTIYFGRVEYSLAEYN